MKQGESTLGLDLLIGKTLIILILMSERAPMMIRQRIHLEVLHQGSDQIRLRMMRQRKET